MKHYLIITATFLFYTLSLAQRADFRTVIQKMNLKGKVQSIREISYLGDLEGKPILSKIDSTKDNCLYLFQTDGNINSTTNYLTSGKVYISEVFKYDTRGVLIEKSTSNNNNGKVNKTVIEYDSLYFKLKETVIDNKGQIISQQIGKSIMKDSNNYTYLRSERYNETQNFTFSYSDGGNLVYKVQESTSGYYLKFKYYYNSNNLLIRQTVEKVDRKPFSQQEFEYDNKGNLTKLTEKVPYHIVSYTYEYNKQGDWIKRVAETKRTGVNIGRQRNTKTVTIREIKYL
ncbi:MAG: hypothetical protein ABIR78_10845 [Ferruginibacter sp.]